VPGSGSTTSSGSPPTGFGSGHTPSGGTGVG
jgi:hypothetical protein